MKNINLYKRLLLRLLFLIIAILILLFAAPLFFSLFSPFILALIMAAALNPLVSFLDKKLRVSRRVIAFAMVLLVFTGLASLIAWFIYTLVRETISLAKNIQILIDYFNSSYELLSKRLEWLISYLPGDTDETINNFFNSVFGWLQDSSRGLADYILSNTKTVTVKAGNVVLSTIMFILSAYFITVDYSSFGEYLNRFKHSYLYNRIIMIKDVAKSAFGGYIKAQLLLALLVFALVLPSLTIYGQEYAFLIALVAAIIDFLPFIGTAVLLVPWAVLCFIGGDVVKAVFLIILSLSVFLIRRFVEPKIMSTQTGLTPLVALLSTYVGMKLAGVAGIILGPVITIILISVIKAGVFENTKNDIKELVKELSGTFRREDKG